MFTVYMLKNQKIHGAGPKETKVPALYPLETRNPWTRANSGMGCGSTADQSLHDVSNKVAFPCPLINHRQNAFMRKAHKRDKGKWRATNGCRAFTASMTEGFRHHVVNLIWYRKNVKTTA